MKAYKATVEILLDPRIVGPNAPLWNSPADAADEFSAMLSENPDILDWHYLDNGNYSVIEIDPDSYEEGEMTVTGVIEKVRP